MGKHIDKDENKSILYEIFTENHKWILSYPDSSKKKLWPISHFSCMSEHIL